MGPGAQIFLQGISPARELQFRVVVTLGDPQPPEKPRPELSCPPPGSASASQSPPTAPR